MQPQSHTSLDRLITLTSEPTRTINAEYPQGFDDWIIALTPGDWHTHPDPVNREVSSKIFIQDILEDRTILQIWYKYNQIEEIRILNTEWETIESEIARFESDPIPGCSITHRLWSGRILINSSDIE